MKAVHNTQYTIYKTQYTIHNLYMGPYGQHGVRPDRCQALFPPMLFHLYRPDRCQAIINISSSVKEITIYKIQ